MKIKLYLLLLLSVILLQSCSGRIKTAAAPSLMQKVDYDGAVISEKKHTVSLTHFTEFKHVKHKIIFTLLIQNRGRESFSITNESISMEFRGKDKDSAPMKLVIQPLEDFLKDLENDYFNANIKTISDIFRDLENTIYVMENSSGDNKAIAEMFASRFYSAVGDLDETIRVYDLLEEIISPLVFKPQTIIPGCSVTGLLIYDINDIAEKAEGEFHIVISIEGEEHRFVFSRSR